jgi:hypothetical protein
MEYDFEIDTTYAPLPELARELYQGYQCCRHPGAYERLRKRFAS